MRVNVQVECLTEGLVLWVPRLIGQSQLKEKWISYPLIQTLQTNHEQRGVVDSSMVAHVKKTHVKYRVRLYEPNKQTSMYKEYS